MAEDSLVMRRSKRSNAGNRMEAVLADFRAESNGMDVDEDVDFVVEKDEEDAFESDFESTDEEAQSLADDLAENVVREEERAVRKASRSKLDRVTAAAHAKQKDTFHPLLAQASTSRTAVSAAEKLKRRVSLGVAIDAETGEVVKSAKRKSGRIHTMLNTSATVSRMRDAEEKKSFIQKKVKAKIRAPTQDELIARALDMEEGNIIEHRDYLSIEEEKRKRARLVRTAVQGPLLRVISKVEEVKVKVEPVPYSAAPYHYTYSPTPYSSTAQSPSAQSLPSPSYFHPSATVYHPPQPASTQSSSIPAAGVLPLRPFQHGYVPPNPTVQGVEPVERTEKVSRNYVVHELVQTEDEPRPSWLSTMKAMFGDHVNWDELRVYTAKGRPFARPTQICPMSGRIARYLDPRSNVPFADVAAYSTLSKILAHEYVWCDHLGCYILHEDEQSKLNVQ
ncbi:YL1 nuclear protein-domain-containing protein [Sparassis latifolia]